MTEASKNRRTRLRLGPLLRVVLPSLVTLVLIVLLMFTMFFTEFDWQWVVFLAGILFASVLSLVSASWKSRFRVERRTAESIRFRERLSAEVEQHRKTREQLERELALHQQDRARMLQETEAHRLAAAHKRAAENLLGSLERYLEEIAVFVDADRTCRFHTRRFAAWAGVPSGRIDGRAYEEALSALAAESLRPQLLDALDGRAGRVEFSRARPDGSEERVAAEFLPQRDGSGKVSGALVLIMAPRADAGAGSTAGDQAAGPDDANIVIADESGNAVYLKSLTEELSGWGDPRERIRDAIDNDGFDLYAQDIVALRRDVLPGRMHELLIRMHDEERNLVPPGTFLPIAERFGMMPDIDRLVVKKAIAAHLAAARAAGAASAPVLCINLARASIQDPAFPEFVARALEQSGASGEALCFELEDGDAISLLAEASRFAYALKPLGCRFTLDGFGRAGIGFDHVKTLPLDFLKIDGRMILQILRVPEALAKVRAIVRVCKVIGIRTIAEMVEDDESMEKLRAAEVDYAQGFGIAKPRRVDASFLGASS